MKPPGGQLASQTGRASPADVRLSKPRTEAQLRAAAANAERLREQQAALAATVPRLVTPAAKRQGPTPAGGVETPPLRGWSQGPESGGGAARDPQPAAARPSAPLQRPAGPPVLPEVPPEVADGASSGPALQRPAAGAERDVPEEARRERGPPLRQGRGDPAEGDVQSPGWARSSRGHDEGRFARTQAQNTQEHSGSDLTGDSQGSPRDLDGLPQPQWRPRTEKADLNAREQDLIRPPRGARLRPGVYSLPQV